MLEAGDRAPLETRVWVGPQQEATLGDLVAEGPILLVFYLFDWSSV